MNLAGLIDRMISAGVPPGEAGAIAAEIFAAGVASVEGKSTAAMRQQRYRDRKKEVATVTNRNESVTERNGDEASQSVTNRNEGVTSLRHTVSPIEEKNIKNSKRQNSDRASRGTRIDPDWSPSPAEKEFALGEGLAIVEIDRQAARFRDYWKGKAGSGGVKLDWTATWKNWIRTTAEKLGRSPRAQAGPVGNGSLFHAKFGSEELDAWDVYVKQKTGKTCPRDAKGGWSVPTQWPPGYVPREQSEPVIIPMLRGAIT